MTQDLKYYFDLVKNFNKKYKDLLDAYEELETSNKAIEDKTLFNLYVYLDLCDDEGRPFIDKFFKCVNQFDKDKQAQFIVQLAKRLNLLNDNEERRQFLNSYLDPKNKRGFLVSDLDPNRKILHPSTLIKPFEGFIDEVKMICALYLDKVINENVFKVFKSTIQEIIDDNIINKVHTALDIPYKEEHYSILHEALAIYPLPPIYNHNLYNL
ncbi:MAG: hypothetical protein CMC98_05750 [Flavobacteriales bacterium]|nr:hypothetical protein [Flavobacteriales bacterium]|tara:strand:- start:2471 stop:3103 length:633 start_codon:yes stop_codon:yes gene_type:complete